MKNKKQNQNVTTVGVALQGDPKPQRHDPKNQKGITLIALVITIIVLLILAGVTIAMLTGENGILKNAQKAKIETRGASVEEARDLWFVEIQLAKTTGGVVEDMETVLNNLKEQGLLTQEEVDIIKDHENNEITIGSRTISFKAEYVMYKDKEGPKIIAQLSSSNLTESSFTLNLTVKDTHSGINKIEWYYKLSTEEEYTKVVEEFEVTKKEETKTKEITELEAGTYKAYAIVYDTEGNSTKSEEIDITLIDLLANQVEIGDYVAYDANDTEDDSIPTYTSPKGAGNSHGNGYASQTFTSSSSIKWRVFSTNTTTGEVVLISEAPIQTDAGADFSMYGAVGYLYAEEELNKACAIYGKGRGANIEKTFTYKTGDEIEGYKTGTITGSGGRSIKVDDINGITGYNPATATKPYTYTIYYPTTKTTTGYSTSASNTTYTHTLYGYDVSKYLSTESEIYIMLFRDLKNSENIGYWLSSRVQHVGEPEIYPYVNFAVRRIGFRREFGSVAMALI